MDKRAEQRTQVIPSPGRFGELFSAFDSATSVKGKERAATALADYAIRDNDDCISIFLALTKAISATQNPNKRARDGGFAILSGIEDYFAEMQVSYKMLAPLEYSIPTDNLKSTWDNVLKNFPTISRRYPSAPKTPLIQTFLSSCSMELNKPQTPQQEKLQQGLIVSTVVHTGSKSFEPGKSILELHRSIFTKCAENDVHNSTKNLGLPQTLIDIITKASELSDGDLPDLLTTSFEGLSLQDVLAEEHADLRYIKLLRFVAHMPQGDHLWRSLITGIFFASPPENAQLLSPPEEKLERDLFELTQAMANYWLLSGLSLVETVPGVDTLFSAALNNLSTFNVQNLASKMYYTSLNQSDLYKKFYPGITVEELAYECPLITFAYSEWKKAQPQPQEGTQPAALPAAHTLIRNQLIADTVKIKTTLSERIPTQQATMLFDTFLSIALKEQFYYVGLQYADLLKKHLGESVIDKMEQNQAELEAATEQMQSCIKKYADFSRLETDPTLIEDNGYDIEFVSGTEGNSLCITHFSFVPHAISNGTGDFIVHTIDPTLNFPVVMNFDGSIKIMGIERSMLQPALETALEFVVVIAFSEYLKEIHVLEEDENSTYDELIERVFINNNTLANNSSRATETVPKTRLTLKPLETPTQTAESAPRARRKLTPELAEMLLWGEE